MRKTSVYLTDADLEQLRRAAAREGRSQAALIRQAVRDAYVGAPTVRRQFRSLGKGHGEGRPYSAWRSEDLYREAMGER